MDTPNIKDGPLQDGNYFPRGASVIDNSLVVPYNPVLLKLFDAHINVEICNSLEIIKYLMKYVNKGSDQIMFAVNANNGIDEISNFPKG